MYAISITIIYLRQNTIYFSDFFLYIYKYNKLNGIKYSIKFKSHILKTFKGHCENSINYELFWLFFFYFFIANFFALPLPSVVFF